MVSNVSEDKEFRLINPSSYLYIRSKKNIIHMIPASLARANCRLLLVVLS
jgi:hypothetical protein